MNNKERKGSHSGHGGHGIAEKAEPPGNGQNCKLGGRVPRQRTLLGQKELAGALYRYQQPVEVALARGGERADPSEDRGRTKSGSARWWS